MSSQKAITKGAATAVDGVIVSKSDHAGRKGIRLQSTLGGRHRLNVESVTGVAVIIVRDTTPAAAIAPRPVKESPPLAADLALQREFSELVRNWRVETMKHSNADDITGHLSYYQIVALGERALPLIFQEIKQGMGFLLLALRAITRKNPVKPEHMGRRREMTEDWLTWGRENGYIQS